jgi:hypothetical protein
MDLGKFSREELIVGGIALLLAIDLLFLPWFDISVGIGSFSVSATSTATGAPDGWLGVLAVLALLALVADVVLAGIEGVSVPALGGSRANTRLALAAAAAAFIALKFLFHIHFGLFGFGFWAAVVLAGGLVALVARERVA